MGVTSRALALSDESFETISSTSLEAIVAIFSKDDFRLSDGDED